MMVSTEFGKYTLEAELAHDELGRSYRAWDRVLDRPAFLWVLNTTGRLDDDAREAWLSQVRSLAGVRHPSLPLIFDVGDHDGAPFVACEYIAGASVAARTRLGERWPASRLAAVAVPVANALAALHGHGLMHGDLTADRIFLGDGGEVKLLALGAARRLGTARPLGTLGAGALSPEQARGERVDYRADWYTLGCVLYELATGQPPHRAPTALATAIQHMTDTPTPPRQLNPALPPAVDDLIMRLLAKDPAQRAVSADDVRRAFAAPPPPANPVDPEESLARSYGERSGAGGFMLFGVLAVLIGLMVGVFLVFGPDLFGRTRRSNAPDAPPITSAPAPDLPSTRIRTEPETELRVKPPANTPTTTETDEATNTENGTDAAPSTNTPAPGTSEDTPPEEGANPRNNGTTDQPAPEAPPIDKDEAADQVKDTVQAWRDALREGDLDRHVEFYAPQMERYFRQSGVSQGAVAADKRSRLPEGTRVRRLRVRNVKVSVDDAGVATVELDKQWRIEGSKPSEGEVRQRLRLRKFGDEWKIISEVDE